MDINDIRRVVVESQKYPGTRITQHASVCNKGFPGTFNLSYAEAEMIEHFGQYLDYDKDFIYSKIQPVIRFQDWSHIVNADEHGYRYLSVFDMADVGGAMALKNGNASKDAVQFSLNALATFLFEGLQLDRSKIRISYFSGGSVTQVSGGKYALDVNLSSDDTIGLWRGHGIRDDQQIADKTRNTLLALNIYGLPTPWGFRQEINYLHEDTVLDIGTFEYLFLRPIFKDDRIIDLRRWEHVFVTAAVGLERLLMVKNN